MTATPKFGSFTFVGVKTGKTYTKEIYVSDVNAALIQWDLGAGAGASSGNFWKTPEPVILIDFAMVTGTADTEKIRLNFNGVHSGHILRYDTHLTSLATRERLNIKILANVDIRGYQISD